MHSKLNESTRNAIAFIEKLCQDGLIDWPIDFEINNASDAYLAETFGHWFGGKRWAEGGDSFVQFGQDGTGSMFLLWYYPDLSIEPPVVFLGSEGESCLVASNLEDFTQQLASGKLFYDGAWLDPEEDEDHELDWQSLAQSVTEHYGQCDATPEQLRENAQRTHPDFTQWVESKIEYV